MFLITCFSLFLKQQSVIQSDIGDSAQSLLAGEEESWDEFYSSTDIHQKVDFQNAHVAFNDNNNYYVVDCNYISVNSELEGGPLMFAIKSLDHKQLIENSVFISCSSNKIGGAIYSSSTSSFIISKVCCYKCTSPTCSAIYSATDSDGGTTNRNEIHQTSVFNCRSEGDNTIVVNEGASLIRLLNETANECKSFSCLSFGSNKDHSGLIKLSSFTNNIAKQYTCILFNSVGKDYSVEECNIFENKQSNVKDHGIISNEGILTIKGSCIAKNDAYRVIKSGANSKVTFDGCYIDLYKQKVDGKFKVVNDPKETLFNLIKLFSTDNCGDDTGHANTIYYPTIACKEPTREKHKSSQYSSILLLFNVLNS